MPSEQANQHGFDCEVEDVVGWREWPSANNGNTNICSASAAMARISADWKRQRDDGRRDVGMILCPI